MAETGWTDEFPQVDGAFYWRRLKADHANFDIGELVDDTLCCTGESTHTRSYIRKDFEYLGPVTAADFEQLTRLREAIRVEIHHQCAHCKNGLVWTRDNRQHISEDRDMILIVNCMASLALRNALSPQGEALAQRNTGGK